MSSERPFEIKRIDHLVLRVQDCLLYTSDAADE